MVLFFMSNSSARLHGLDVLRGVAMILGVFLHGAIAYKKGYHVGNWVFDAPSSSWFFDGLYLWINSFRMQLFFLLAGFFTRLLIRKIGLWEFAKNRFRRIGIPFFLAYFTILPLTLIPYLYAEYQAAGQEPWSHLREFMIAFFTMRAHAGIMHLWFLEHLIVYYSLAIGVLFVVGRARGQSTVHPDASGQAGPQSTVNTVRHPAVNVFSVLAVTTVVAGGITLLFNAPLPSIWPGLFIPPSQFLYYCFFFVLGFILEGHRELFGSFNRVYKPFLLAGSLLSILTLYIVNMYGEALPPLSSPIILLKFIFALQSMLLVIGFIGLFNAVFREPSPFWKYIADAAYWVYLIHMPVVLTTQLLLRDSVVPGILRFPVVITVTLAICFISYHYLVRYTWVGALLNGKRN